jgi:hypothetical protein
VALDPVTQAAIDASVQEALRKAPRPIFRPAVVMDVDLESSLPLVVCDGPDEQIFGAQLLSGAVFPGDRVEIMFLEPHGAFIVGRRGGDFDPWHIVGAEGEPQFATGWTNTSPGTGPDGTDNHSVTKFRRLYRMVELRGLPGRASGSGTLIFQLPPDYTPENNLSFVVPHQLGTALLEVRGYGSPNPGGIIMVVAANPGVGIPVDQIKFSVDPRQDTLAGV